MNRNQKVTPHQVNFRLCFHLFIKKKEIVLLSFSDTLFTGKQETGFSIDRCQSSAHFLLNLQKFHLSF